MNMKRILSAVLTLAMILTMAAIPLTSMAADSLMNGEPKKVALSTGDMELFNGSAAPFKPSKDAAGMTLWLRVEGAKDPFILGGADIGFKTNNDFIINARNHGQDGIREAMWTISANGDYLMWIPFEYYTLSHQFVGKYTDKDGKEFADDYVTEVSSIKYRVETVSAANKDATISCMGIFEGKVEGFNTEFDVKGTKTTKEGTYQYMNATHAIGKEFGGVGFTANSLYSNCYYDRETNLIVDFENFKGYNKDNMTTDDKGEAIAVNQKYKNMLEFVQNGTAEEKDPRAVCFTDTIEKTWQYCYVGSFAYPVEITLGATEVFNGWKDADGNPMIPYGANKLTADIKTEASVTKHTVTFMNGSETLGTAQVADGGQPIYSGVLPTKAATATETYVFSGWEAPEGKSAMAITEDITLTAAFKASPIVYTVIYCDEDGTRLATEGVNGGENAKKTIVPSKNGTKEKYYTFAKWVTEKNGDTEAPLTNILADVTVYAAYTEANETGTYTITFVNYDDAEIKKIEQGVHSYVVYDGDTPTRPLDQDYIYTFSGWDKDLADIRENTTVKAQYSTSDVEKGHKAGADLNVTAKLGTEEIKLIDDTNAYTLETPNEFVTLVFKATGVETSAVLGGFRMAIIGVMGDGKDTGVSEAKDQGNFVNYKDPFTLDEDGYYYLTVKWSMVSWQAEKGLKQIKALSFNNPDSPGVKTQNTNENLQLEFISLYEGKPEFTVRLFEGEDFINIETIKKPEGGGFAFGKLTSATDATKAEDEHYSYTFNGWKDADGNAVNAVYDNMDLYADFTKTILHPVKVTFMDRTEKLSEDDIPEGTPAVEPEKKPTVYSDASNSYIFRGWTTDADKQEQTAPVTGLADMTAAITTETTFYAVYEKVDKMPEITFYAENKTDVLGKSLVYQGKLIPEAPTAAVKPNTDEFTYTFEGWADKDGNLIADLTKLTANTDVYAKYKETKNELTVTFMDGDKEMAKVTVKYGEAATAPSTAKTHKKPYLVYEFKGWDKEFTNVTENMTVNASYDLVFKSTFTDIEDDWYTKAVEWALINEHMSGDNKEYTLFAPHKSTSRAMLAQVLYNIEGRPDISEFKNQFTDVEAGQWYTDAVIWAYNNKVVYGVDKEHTKFNPNGDITREEMATMLYRYAQNVKKLDVSYNHRVTFADFADRNDISEFAQDPLKYALDKGFISGTKDDGVLKMDPQGATTRAQMASMLMRFVEKAK